MKNLRLFAPRRGCKWILVAGLLVCALPGVAHADDGAEPQLSALRLVARDAITLWAGYFDRRSRGLHKALDIAAPKGSKVRASEPGVVIRRAKHKLAGKYVEVDHGDGRVTRYLHLKRFSVHVGQQVRLRTVLGRVGATGNATGPHLHFELVENGRHVDPLPYLRQLSEMTRRERRKRARPPLNG